MMDYDYRSRMQMASERAARVADDYARANARSYRRRARRQLPAVADHARRGAARPQLGA